MHHCIGFTKQNHNFSKFLLGCTPLWLGSTGLVDLQTKKPQVHILAFLPSPSESSDCLPVPCQSITVVLIHEAVNSCQSCRVFHEWDRASLWWTDTCEKICQDWSETFGWMALTLTRTHTSQHTDQTTSGYPIILLLIYHPCFPSLLFSLGGYGLFRRLFSLTVRQLKANICSVLWGDS